MTVRTLIGDCREILPTLDAESVDCIVTSPPYFGLRDYGVAGQIGLEPTLDAYVETMAQVGRELWRVLKPSGTFWLNLGDTYAANRGYQVSQSKHQTHDYGKSNASRVPNGLKPKDLCLVPERVAMRLQADGWWIRSRIIWHKMAPMPESVKDRPTSAHEHIWMLTKSPTYWYDAEAIAEECTGASGAEGRRVVRVNSPKNRAMGLKPTREYDHELTGGRNARNVWSMSHHGAFSGAHFATMPPAIAERCILAGCPKGGTVLDPFGGAGTTGLVADRLGRNALLIELNPSYVELQRDRITGDAPLFAEVVTL